jgi:hypothetical protein
MKKIICLIAFLIGIFGVQLSEVSTAAPRTRSEVKKTGFQDTFKEKQWTTQEKFVDNGSGTSKDDTGSLRDGIGEIPVPSPVTDGLYFLLLAGAAYGIYCFRRTAKRI